MELNGIILRFLKLYIFYLIEEKQQNKSEIGSKFDAINEEFLYSKFDDLDLLQIMKYAKDPCVSYFVKKVIFPVKYQDYWFNLKGRNVENELKEYDIILDTSIKSINDVIFQNEMKR